MPPVTKNIYSPLRKQLFQIYPKAITYTVKEKSNNSEIALVVVAFSVYWVISDDVRMEHTGQLVQGNIILGFTRDPIYVDTAFQHGLIIIRQKCHCFRSSDGTVTAQSKFRLGSSSMMLMFLSDAILARSSYSYLHRWTPYPKLVFLRIVP